MFSHHVHMTKLFLTSLLVFSIASNCMEQQEPDLTATRLNINKYWLKISPFLQNHPNYPELADHVLWAMFRFEPASLKNLSIQAGRLKNLITLLANIQGSQFFRSNIEFFPSDIENDLRLLKENAYILLKYYNKEIRTKKGAAIS